MNVPLSRVSTNSELMSIFFDNKYRIEGGDVPIRLGFKDVIFVMEDVDELDLNGHISAKHEAEWFE